MLFILIISYFIEIIKKTINNRFAYEEATASSI